MTMFNLPLAAPNPATIADQVRMTIYKSFLAQLDNAYQTNQSYIKTLLDSGSIVMSPVGQVESISEDLENALFQGVDDVTQSIGFALVRNAQLRNITPEGVLKPVELIDYLRSADVADKPTTFLKVRCILAVEPANPAETEAASKAYAAVTSQAN